MLGAVLNVAELLLLQLGLICGAASVARLMISSAVAARCGGISRALTSVLVASYVTTYLLWGGGHLAED